LFLYDGRDFCKMELMVSGRTRRLAATTAALCAACWVGPTVERLCAQVIEYEANGMKYQTLSHQGLTVIVTQMPDHVAGFSLFQISVSNGSDRYWMVDPEKFSYARQDVTLNALSAGQVVDVLLDKGSHADVIKLVTSYENSLYGIPHMKSTNGYEQRREGMMTYGINAKIKAAATASAIALAQVRLAPGQSTDGSIFIPLTKEVKALNGGRLIFKSYDQAFEFNPN
jgi:hypothetical protein